MDLSTIMVVRSEMKKKSNCYVKVIKKDYCDNSKLILNYHLLFLSKLYYKKIRKIEKMLEKYHYLKQKYFKTDKEYNLIYYLKKIIIYLKECTVIEILSDDKEAFKNRFYHILKFVTESYIYNPKKSILSYKEENKANITHITLFKKNVNERLKKYTLKVKDLLREKILHHLS